VQVPSTRGVTLELHDLGGDGEPLLMAHATGFCARAYEPLVPRLAAAGFHVWGVDFRGHGDSTRPADGDFAWTGMAEDVLAVVDALDQGAVFAFGHSMGGAALLLAETMRPGSIRRAYLYEPIVMSHELVAARNQAVSERPPEPEASAIPLAAMSRRRRASFPSRADALMRYATRPTLNVLRADALAAYVQHAFKDAPDGTVTLKCDPEDEAKTFESARITIDEVRDVGVPLTVAMGEREPESMPAAFAPTIAASLAHAELLPYRHLGHFGPLQDPDTVADDMLARF
jgi:pimeloyl-ACP methyl ester carboxylesterase